MIEAKDVALTYGDGTKALRNVNLTVQPGELVYITGHSGSGKTSLLKLLMGIEHPTAGKLTVLSQRMRKGNDRKLRKLRRKIGPVFQEFKLIEKRTALENVMVGMRILGIPPGRMKQEATEALKRVGLEHRIHTPVEHLSWGEAQRVAIARAVVRKPMLLIADEPTGNLDHDNALKILDILTSFRDEKTAVIITTHATHLIEGQEATYIRVKEGEITIERRGGETGKEGDQKG